MKKIDRETVQRILDTADIVEVVSDFVSLKKRGANYIGLCPFHNERTPSFSVSRAKGICKCFSCGKGGSPVNFIMEHEQMSFNEALRYLAKKYHIEVKEQELTEEEQQQASEREAMLAVNDFALNHFRSNLTETDDGRDIGLAYFRERGINDQMIQRFKLGYAIDRPDDLLKVALSKGYEEKYLLDTGLCARSEKTGQLYDKFRGRVIYPVFSVSGRVVAFGARTLRSDKTVAKYLNSPQSLIYNKSREIYGLYQAKQHIVRHNKCIMVEGYMDVISMHQVGVENVVASSGTSLTEGQIRLIHRFTENVTLIYDADAAGIKASLRGIDMLLAEGLNTKVLLLPQGEDPDSFAQSHSASEVERYIEENETDFIRFKTSILLKDAKNDPIARARVINDIIRSISVIPDAIVRVECIKECSRMLEIAENTLMLQLQKAIGDNLVKEKSNRPQVEENEVYAPDANKQQESQLAEHPQDTKAGISPDQIITDKSAAKICKYEEEILKYIVKYGMANLSSQEDEPISVIQYIWQELENDGISFSDPVFAKIYALSIDIYTNRWPSDAQACVQRLTADYNAAMEAGRDDIRINAIDLSDIESRERKLKEKCDNDYMDRMDQYAVSYLENILVSSPDDDVRRVSTNLAYEKYTLSKVHTRYAHIETERERLSDLVPRAIVELKLGILNQRIDYLKNEIRLHSSDPSVVDLLQEQKKLYEIRSQISKYLGERIVTPR